MRMIFCFFACDVGLLPKEAFEDLISVNKTNPEAFRNYLSDLFGAMKDGGSFLMRDVPHFNGGLFDDTFVPRLIADQIAMFERLNQSRLVGHRAFHIRHSLRARDRREQAQAAWHSLHLQGGH